MDYSQTNVVSEGRWEIFSEYKHLNKGQPCFPNISNPFTKIGAYELVGDCKIMQKNSVPATNGI